MSADEGSSKRGWTIAAVIGGVALLLFCAVGGCCLWGVMAAQSGVLTATEDAEAYRGRPIGECYDASFERMLACGNTDFGCRFGAQALFTQCTHVSTEQPGFCDEHAVSRGYCDARCSGAANPSSCQSVCGQLSVPVGQYCGAR